MGKNTSWVGTLEECAASIGRLYTETGELHKYTSVLDAPPDVAYMCKHKDKIQNIHARHAKAERTLEHVQASDLEMESKRVYRPFGVAHQRG